MDPQGKAPSACAKHASGRNQPRHDTNIAIISITITIPPERTSARAASAAQNSNWRKKKRRTGNKNLTSHDQGPGNELIHKTQRRISSTPATSLTRDPPPPRSRCMLPPPPNQKEDRPWQPIKTSNIDSNRPRQPRTCRAQHQTTPATGPCKNKIKRQIPQTAVATGSLCRCIRRTWIRNMLHVHATPGGGARGRSSLWVSVAGAFFPL